LKNSESQITETKKIPENRIRKTDNSVSKKKAKMHSAKLWMAFITVFISGTVIGAVCILGVIHSKIEKKAKERTGPEKMSMRITSHIAKELNLSEEQRQKAKMIITTMSSHLFEIRKTQQNEIKKTVKNSFANIEDLLTEEQKQKFKKIQKRVASCPFKGQPGKRHGQKKRRFPGGRGKIQHNRNDKTTETK